MADWSHLPKEIVIKIAEHVEIFEDFENLQWICMPWRSAAKEANFRACVNIVRDPSSLCHEHTLPWLMLSDSSNTRHLYSLSKRMVRYINLPSSFANVKSDKVTLLSSLGWLLVAAHGRTRPVLFYPFSGAVIRLPIVKFRCNYNRGLKTFYWHEASRYKFILSANPVTTSDYTVFLSLFDHNPTSILVFWRNGDDRWRQVLHPRPAQTWSPDMFSFGAFLVPTCKDIAYYQGEFYGVNCYNMVVKFTTAQGSPYFEEVTSKFAIPNNVGEKTCYFLVESGCQLLLVRQLMLVDNYRYETKKFEVFELNVENGTVKRVPSLGNRAIFLGVNSSFSVEISSLAHGFKPNCIYYSGVDEGKQRKFRGHGRDGRDHCLYSLTHNKVVERSSYNGHLSRFGTQFMWLESPICVNNAF